jgi:PRTRC genetic system protein A
MLPNSLQPADYIIWRNGQNLEMPTGKAFIYLLAGNGVFKLAESANIRALIPLARVNIAGLPDLRPDVQSKKGKIPARLLSQIIRDARQQAPHEAMYHLCFQRGVIRAYRPPQLADAAHIDYAGGDNTAILCDLHSHCTMHAFFSGTDNGDEQGFRFYVVIGQIFRNPQIRVRVGVYGDHYPVPATTLFESLPNPVKDCYLKPTPREEKCK